MLILDLTGSVDLADLFGGVEGASRIPTASVLLLGGIVIYVAAAGSRVSHHFAVLLRGLHCVPGLHHFTRSGVVPMT